MEQMTLVDEVVYKTARRFGVSPEEVVSRSRTKNVAMARHVVIWILSDRFKFSSTHAAYVVGRCDHTTAIYAVKRVNEDDHLRNEATSIANSIEHQPIGEQPVMDIRGDVRIGTDVLRWLQPYAKIRGVSTSVVARSIVTAAVMSGIVDSVIDDGIRLDNTKTKKHIQKLTEASVS